MSYSLPPAPVGGRGASTAPTLSIVIPVFNEEDNLPVLLTRLAEVRDSLGVSSELVLVDDGSSDASPSMLRDAASSAPGTIAVLLSRNFGHQAAISAGFQYTSGQAVAVLDADLQDPPELLGEMLEKWRAGYHVVYARRKARAKEGIIKRAAASVFYRLLRRLVPFNVPVDVGDFSLMDRRIVDLLNALPERNRYVRGLRSWMGYSHTFIEYERPPRYAGKPKYTFGKSLSLALDAIVSFSALPLRVTTYVGFGFAVGSLALGIWFIIERLFIGGTVRGWASLIVVVCFIGGMQLLGLGIIGQYISRIYDEVKQRPMFLVREVVGKVVTDGVPSRTTPTRSNSHALT
jgi:glycosyltransferase involved in cell wall biosynthesis